MQEKRALHPLPKDAGFYAPLAGRLLALNTSARDKASARTETSLTYSAARSWLIGFEAWVTLAAMADFDESVECDKCHGKNRTLRLY